VNLEDLRRRRTGTSQTRSTLPTFQPTTQVSSEVSLIGLRVDEAEAELHRALDGAVLADLPALRIIHGKGTGTLRDLVQRVLRADPRVATFATAPGPQGGTGVTIAELRA
jgi:DNA mismatch repair protein MutS2